MAGPARTAARPPVVPLPEEPKDGLQYAWLIRPDAPPEPLELAGVDAALEQARGIVWVHLNATALPAKEWLTRCRQVPAPIREDLLEADNRTRLEPLGGGILGVIGDVGAWADPDPWHVYALRFYLTRHLLLTTRRQPVNCATRLSRAVRAGLRARSTAELLVTLLTHTNDAVTARARELARETDETEDTVLEGDIGRARRRLGQARRRAAVLRRQVTIRPRALERLRGRLPAWLSDNDRYELLEALDRMETTVEELSAIEQREAQLEAEVASRLAEETNRNLYVLSIVTVLFAPMTLITGIFGMNVDGLPGVHDPTGFLWVMVSMILASVVVLVAMHWRRFF